VSDPPRKILHLDLDAFFCAVEEQRDPSLVGKPFAVGGRPDERGVVSSCSYAARRLGIHSAMPMGQALRLCPQLRIISPHFPAYRAASQNVMAELHALTSSVEQISIDEAFLDVSALPEAGEVLARQLQQRIRDQYGLPCSLGIASNKLLAKIANDVGKAANRGAAPPCAITLVPAGQEAEFLAPLPVERLWGVGPKTAARLAEIDIRTIGDLARHPESDLVGMFGKNGHDLHRHALGLDDSPIVTAHEPKSISQEITFSRDVTDIQKLHHSLNEMSIAVARHLQKSGYAGSTVKLKLRWPDFTTLTRQMTLSVPTDQAERINAAALALFEKVWQPGKRIRLLGVGVSGLVPPVRQLNLWDENDGR
jgi:DNA polymerase IV